MSVDRVSIRYHRPPDRLEVFEQEVVLRTPVCVVTLLDAAILEHAIVIDGATVLDPGAPVVWFTFPGAWHDIGRFHTRDGTFTGCYANVLTPVEGVDGAEWRTTDLFLDLWQPGAGDARILDEDELEAAHAAGALDSELAARARNEAAALLREAHAGRWPPAIVHHWTLARVRRHVRR